MLTFDVHAMPYTIIPAAEGRPAVHQYAITQGRKIGSLTIEAKTLLTSALRQHLRDRLQAIADETRNSGTLRHRVYLRPACAREPRGWKTFTRDCPGIDI